MGAPGPSTAPRDVLLSQSASTYNEDLRKALNLSKKHMDGASIEKEEMERAFKMSLLDSSKPKTEEERIEIAIKASLKHIGSECRLFAVKSTSAETGMGVTSRP